MAMFCLHINVLHRKQQTVEHYDKYVVDKLAPSESVKKY